MDTLTRSAMKEDQSVSKCSSRPSVKSKSSVRPKVNKVASSNSKQVAFAKPRRVSNLFEKVDIVEHYLESVVLQSEGLHLIKDLKLLVRQDHESMTDRVKIMSGGSSGMEPLHSGFVGHGMLTAAVFGEVSSSPPYLSILEAIRLLSKHNTPGVLVIVMNNVADRLNFGLACQLAAHEGIKTMCLTVGEDCSGVGVDKTIGRQGLCGILFLQKIAGAMSEEYRTLYEIYSVLMALKGGSLGTVNVSIANNGMFVGSGLRGEPGKFSTHTDVYHVVSEALFYVLNPGSYFSLHIERGDNVAVLVNNFGKLSDLHFALVVREISFRMKTLGFNMVRVYSGRFLTATSYLGFSISVLKVTENVLKWLDSSANVMLWPVTARKGLEVIVPPILHSDSWKTFDFDGVTSKQKNLGPRFTLEQSQMAVVALKSVVIAVTNMEEYLNLLDSDHDYGTNMRRFVTRVQKEMDTRSLNIVTPYGLFNNLAELAATTMGGVSGAIFSVIFSGAAQAFLTSSKFSPIKWRLWIAAVKMARDSVGAYTRSRPGCRTVMDALHPFAESFVRGTVSSLNKAVKAALQGAEDTLHMSGTHKYPDPGAYSLAVALSVVFTELQLDLMTMEEEEEKDAVYCDDCLRLMEQEARPEYCDDCLRLMEQEQGPDQWFCGSCMRVMALEQKEGRAVWFCDSCLIVADKDEA